MIRSPIKVVQLPTFYMDSNRMLVHADPEYVHVECFYDLAERIKKGSNHHGNDAGSVGRAG